MLKTNNKNRQQDRHRWLLIGFLCLFGVCLVAQNNNKQPENKKTKVYLLHADEGQADKLARPDVQVLIGNVKLRHDSMYMYCDSALIFEKTNSVEAFSNVRMEQGDTLFIYGDYLYYDGMTQIAQLRENVKMINRNTTLLTDSLNYDRLYDLGYYFEGGTLMDEENVLTSDWGEYSPATKQSVFNHDVKLVNPKFVLTSDTLRYNTESKIAVILGPSNIVSDNNHIYSERGFYNTMTEQAELLDRSVLTNQGKKLVGDSLFYDRIIGYGEAFDNVKMTDSINKNMLTSDYCFYNELTDSAFATKRAVAIDYSQGPDSLFMHGDTLQLVSYNLNTDSVFRLMKAYHKVRIYRTDVQGVCDSLVYNSKDSCMTMYTDPILWNEGQQLLGEQIKIYMNDSTIDWAHIINQALTVEMKDSIHYNQVSGKEMKAYFINGDMRHIEVIGNVLTAFYPEEKDSTMTGFNCLEGSVLHLYMKDKKMEKGLFIGKSNGTMYPMDQIPSDKLRLPTFAWFDYVRPLNKDDIFNWRGKRTTDVLKPSIDRRPKTEKRKLINMK
ncbi:OstA-like protein [Bacteroides caecimuris]|uniref:OstA-like protein n=1 Tax=Bacteroides caecimuris TaxID=1796613 RepID=UPI00242BD812|nr:OstA-like protein [Bacteroides caecimuris]